MRALVKFLLILLVCSIEPSQSVEATGNTFFRKALRAARTIKGQRSWKEVRHVWRSHIALEHLGMNRLSYLADHPGALLPEGSATARIGAIVDISEFPQALPLLQANLSGGAKILDNIDIVKVAGVTTDAEFLRAFRSMAREDVDSILVMTHGLSFRQASTRLVVGGADITAARLSSIPNLNGRSVFLHACESGACMTRPGFQGPTNALVKTLLSNGASKVVAPTRAIVGRQGLRAAGLAYGSGVHPSIGQLPISAINGFRIFE